MYLAEKYILSSFSCTIVVLLKSDTYPLTTLNMVTVNYVYFFPFSTAIEFSERLSYFGIATSLIIYLTKVIHQDLKTAAQSVNHWAGVTTIMPLVGGFIADAYLGRFSTVLVSSVIYLLVINLIRYSKEN